MHLHNPSVLRLFLSLVCNLLTSILSILYFFSPFLLQVSATFAASLIISPTLGAFLEKAYSENFVIVLASLIALSDVLFIALYVPESLESCSSTRCCSSSTYVDCSNFSTSDSSSLSIGPSKRLSFGAPPTSPSAANVNTASGQGLVVERRRAITWDKVDPFGVSANSTTLRI